MRHSKIPDGSKISKEMKAMTNSIFQRIRRRDDTCILLLLFFSTILEHMYISYILRKEVNGTVSLYNNNENLIESI